MRAQHGVGGCAEGVVEGEWFVLVHVQARTGQAVFLQRSHQRLRLHDWAAGSVDQDGRGLHEREVIGADQAPTATAELVVDAEHI
jgi:hypothetical protein